MTIRAASLSLHTLPSLIQVRTARPHKLLMAEVPGAPLLSPAMPGHREVRALPKDAVVFGGLQTHPGGGGLPQHLGTPHWQLYPVLIGLCSAYWAVCQACGFLFHP